MTQMNKGGRPVGLVLPYRPVNNRRSVSDGETVQISVTLDADTFELVDQLARQSNCRISRMAATIIEVGLAEFENGGAS